MPSSPGDGTPEGLFVIIQDLVEITTPKSFVMDRII